MPFSFSLFGNKKPKPPKPTVFTISADGGHPPQNPLVPPKDTGGLDLQGTGVEDEKDEEEELAELELQDAELSAAVTPGTLPPDSNLTSSQPKYHKFFDPENNTEDFFCMLRLMKLKNQVGTQELAHAIQNELTKSISDIAKEATVSLVENLTKQAERMNNSDTKPHTRSNHYSPDGFALLDNSTEMIHQGITTTQQDDKTIITLPSIKDSNNQDIPERTITTWPNDTAKRIMFAASNSDDYSLIILIEGALQAAKKILPTKATFLIFVPPKNPTDETAMEAVAKLSAMANFVGLKPQFQTRPGCEAQAKMFNNQFIKKYGPPALINDYFLADPSKLKSSLQEYLKKIEPTTIYGPSTHLKYLK